MKKSIDFRQVLIYFSTSLKQDCFDFTEPPSLTSTMKTPLKFSALAGLLAASLTLATHSAQAAVIAYDGFEGYTLGDTVGQNGGSGDWNQAWRSYSSTDEQQQVLGSGLSYNSGGIVIDGGSRSVEVIGGTAGTVLQRNFDTTTASTVYFRFLLRLSSDTLDAGDFSSGFLENDGPNMGYRDDGSPGGEGALFARLSPTVYAEDGTLSYNTTYLLIAKLDRSADGTYDDISFWVNPGANDSNSPDATASITTGAANFSTFGLRVGSLLEAADKVVYDEILVSDTWGGAIPEPTTVGLLLGAAGALILLRRRRG
jgi:hypothetical protein